MIASWNVVGITQIIVIHCQTTLAIKASHANQNKKAKLVIPVSPFCENHNTNQFWIRLNSNAKMSDSLFWLAIEENLFNMADILVNSKSMIIRYNFYANEKLKLCLNIVFVQKARAWCQAVKLLSTMKVNLTQMI